MNKRFTILYVDDEASNLHIFKDTFRREYNVLTAISGKEGLDILQKERVDLILSDQRMPEMDGVTFLKKAIQNYPEQNRILITAFSDFDALQSAVNEAQIFQYIQKPWKEEQLRLIIERALDIYYLKKENHLLAKELKVKNDLLVKINDDLVEFEKLKLDFLNTISHEIRTPLNGLVGSVEIIKSGLSTIDPKTIEVLYFILASSVKKLERFLLSVELITFFKAHKYSLKIIKNDLSKVIETVLNDLNEKIVLKNLEVLVDLKNVDSLYADNNLLTIMLKEIIDNSIKYSPNDGKIFISSTLNEDWFIIEVIDQGEGFPANVLKNAFQLFNKGDKVVEDHVGLDLALVKMIMDNHSGIITIQNTINSGASVQLFFKVNHS